mmetsp:Transcript_28351/g.84400  ORF Transcript_28351/g.84400 Transcript_28351/m.84400 type:complete len:218 (-) Transcript_28351:52-705(-)
MSSSIVYGDCSASRATASMERPPMLDSRPRPSATALPSSSSSSSSTDSIVNFLGSAGSPEWGDSCMACTAASSLARVVKPMQNLPLPSTGKSWTSSCESASCTCFSVASGGRDACSGRWSRRSAANLFSMARGGSAMRKGICLRRICSSSKPLSLKSWFRASEMVTLSMSGGMRFGSLAQPVMKTTTATAICLKPHSMAALPTMAYTPETASPVYPQ